MSTNKRQRKEWRHGLQGVSGEKPVVFDTIASRMRANSDCTCWSTAKKFSTHYLPQSEIWSQIGKFINIFFRRDIPSRCRLCVDADTICSDTMHKFARPWCTLLQVLAEIIITISTTHKRYRGLSIDACWRATFTQPLVLNKITWTHSIRTSMNDHLRFTSIWKTTSDPIQVVTFHNLS
jgi:hypothetical protein